MAVYKDKNGTWYVSARYTNWKGEADRKVKRGFQTKREAAEWEKNFFLENAGNLDMTFEVLYWAGLRLGELLALTKKDIDFRRGIIRINKSYQRIDGEDVITEPKTPNSVRNIQMPEFLAEELKDYIDSLYGVDEDDRIFPISKSYLHHEMDRGCAATGVKKIRIHDIRHSHVSLLIDMGFSAVAIANRVGHESIDITFRYAHLFPTRQGDMASKLNDVRC